MRALVTGAAGFLGGRLAQAATVKDWAVTGTFHTGGSLPSGVAGIQMDLCDARSIAKTLDQVQPQVIFHAAAMARPDDCAKDAQLCQATNVEGSRALAQGAKRLGAKMIFVSTDLVYDGENAPYSENAATAPLGVYGHSKLNAEKACFDASAGNATLARTVLMYGSAATAGQSFLHALLQNLDQGKPVNAFFDQLRTPIEVSDLCEALIRCAQKDIQGVIHIAGPEKISRLDFALKAAKIFGKDASLIKKASHAATSFPDPRPMDVCLNTERMTRELEMQTAGPDLGLERCKEHWQ